MESREVFFLIKNIHDKFDARANTDCQKVGLTISQFRVLLFLEAHQNSRVTQKDLELEFKVSHPTINGIINRLENKNFITTQMIKESGKQQKIISLEISGHEALKNMRENRIHDNNAFEENFSEEEKEELLKLLQRLYKILD
ncbi:MAG: MarR family transcriptional regulator [Treponema sp.]|nr:MarR family transcriptional regulator [Treponema sp.]